MTNIDKEIKVSDCTCKGIKIVKDMTDFYTDEVLRHVRGEPRSKLIHIRAKELSNRLYNKLTERETDIKYNVSDNIIKHPDINRFKRGCEEGFVSDCTAKLEMLRQFLHNVPDAREKLICTENPESYKRGIRGESPLSDDIRSLMGRLFTGEFIDQEEGKTLYNPYKRSINKELREECEKRNTV